LGELVEWQERKGRAIRETERDRCGIVDQESPDKLFVKRTDPWVEEYEDENEDEVEDDGGCCPFHRWSTFNAWKNSDVQSVYATCCDYTRRKLFGAPLLVLSHELVINESNIKIVGDNMFFLKGSNSKPLPPINFAACWNCAEPPREFIDLDQEIHAPQFLIPPIMLHEFDQGYHLVLDFSRNDWMT
jgi:hypothetical protein